MAKRKIKSTFLIDSDFWVVVKFIDDGLLSLLRLQEIENLERTEDGVEASLDEGGKCMAPYQGEWYEAKIIRKSEDKEDCLRTKKVFSEKAKADKKNKTETEGKKKNAKADKKNKTEKTEGKQKTEKKKKEVTKKIEKKNKVEEVDETKKKKKDKSNWKYNIFFGLACLCFKMFITVIICCMYKFYFLKCYFLYIF